MLNRLNGLKPVAIAMLLWAGAAMAQSADKVKSDVLSALSTPLPITIVGPMLAQDVEISAEDGSFRATLKGASLMGFFPLGEVSMTLTPLDAETYRITDMQFPEVLDFPGMATISHSSMALEGTWNASTRSYSELSWTINDLAMRPANVPGGELSLGALSFDVAKAAAGGGTESRFVIGAQNVALRGLTPDNVSLGQVEARLLANGEEPVDLYSVIREIAVRSTLRDGGAGLQALAASLLGNTYETASLELSAKELNVVSADMQSSRYLRAKTASISAALKDIAPRNWAAADISLRLGGIEQKDTAADGETSIEEALISLRAGQLPVADMFAVYKLLENGAQGRPVLADALLDGLLSFGKVEVITRGKALNAKALKRIYPSDASKPSELKPHFDVAYESWDMTLGLQGFNRDAGQIVFSSSLSGGAFTPRDAFDDAARPEATAWFPITFNLSSRVGDLNEGFLKQLLQGVSIHDLSEPVELLMPLALYASATVFDVSSGEDIYETALFQIAQSGAVKFYPTELFNLLPYEGRAEMALSGMDNLMRYFADLPARGLLQEDEASVIVGGLTVLRNLGRARGEDTYQWVINRPDVTSTELEVNDVTFRYPSISAMLPVIMSLVIGRF